MQLVQSIDPIRDRFNIQAEWAPFSFSTLCRSSYTFDNCRWFGLILLPLVSFSPEAAVAGWCFVSPFLRRNSNVELEKSRATSLLAHGRPIDLSIQFTLWWMPLLVLFAWWTGKPLHLLFGACPSRLEGGACFCGMRRLTEVWITGRLLRGRAAFGVVLPGQLRDGGREDQLCGGGFQVEGPCARC